MDCPRTFPGFDAFYVVWNPFEEDPYVGETVDASGFDDLVAYGRAEREPASPVVVRHAFGAGTPGDVVWTTTSTFLVLGPKVIETLKIEGFTGWSTFPVSLFLANGELAEGYGGLAISGRCGPLDHTRGERITITGMPGYRGFWFDPSDWDGSDVFMPRGKSWFRIVTERVKEAIEGAGFENISFIRATEFEVDARLVKKQAQSQSERQESAGQIVPPRERNARPGPNRA